MIRKFFISLLLCTSFLLNYQQSEGQEILKRKSVEDTLTVIVNKNGIIPVGELERGRFAIVTIGEAGPFASRLNDYMDMPVASIDLRSAASLADGLRELSQYDRIIAGITDVALPLNREYINNLNELLHFLKNRESVAVFFGSPVFLEQWKELADIDGLVMAFSDCSLSQDLSAQLVFGAIGASGTLQQNAGSRFPAGWGMLTTGGIRLKYTIPEEAGLDSRAINRKVDSIVRTGLDVSAYPGCRLLVAIGGKVIMDRAWGHHTYAQRVAVERNDLYDLASVTKITGPLPVYMKLSDEGKIDLDRPLSDYWDDWKSRLFRRSNKEGLILRDLLTHQSGIVPYINYWEQTVNRRGNYIRRWYRHEPVDGYGIELESHLYLGDKFRKRVYRDIRRSDLLQHGEYRYSCLPFIISPEVIGNIEGRPYTSVLYEDFFIPLGAGSLRYNPIELFPQHRIVPTEVDNNFRRKLVHGYVHDEASAVLGGVSGNAGLFSTAGDLAKLLQMYLNGGEYGGRRYLSQEVLNEYTSVQFPENNNRRGIGFDKPLPDNNERIPERAYPCKGASPESFGHSGFTGTFVWMDPASDLLYIFLSNRVHPSRDNNLISIMNIRTDILQVFYDAIDTACTK